MRDILLSGFAKMPTNAGLAGSAIVPVIPASGKRHGAFTSRVEELASLSSVSLGFPWTLQRLDAQILARANSLSKVLCDKTVV